MAPAYLCSVQELHKAQDWLTRITNPLADQPEKNIYSVCISSEYLAVCLEFHFNMSFFRHLLEEPF